MNRRSTLYLALGNFALLTGSWSLSLWAEGVFLNPAYISGQAAVSTPGQKVRSLSLSASGGGYSASKNVSQSNAEPIEPIPYSMTVQGGDWETAVSATATASPVGSNYPYTNIYFSPNTLSVPATDPPTTVTGSNYSTDATVQFQLSFTTDSDPYTRWDAYAYARKDMPSGKERTYSYSYSCYYTDIYYRCNDPNNSTWDMPVVANSANLDDPNDQGVRIYAYVSVYGTHPDGTGYTKYYYFWYQRPDYRYEDIAPGDTLMIPLEITHTAPDSQVPGTGAVQGTVDLGLTVDGIDYSNRFKDNYPYWPYSYHYVYGQGRAYAYSNPGDYLIENVPEGTHQYRVRTYYLHDRLSELDPWRYSHLYWPYTGGEPANDQVTVLEDQISQKDFSNATGILTGKLLFNGSLKTKDLDWYQLRAYGSNHYQYHYEPEVGYIYTYEPTYGGYAYDTVYADDEDKSYRMFLTPGPWQPYYLRARTTNTDLLGYNSSTDITIYDYNYYYDGNYNDFGQPADVVGGLSTQENFNYRIGGVSMCFEVAGGDSLRSPSVYGNANLYNQDGKREKRFNVSGWSSPDPSIVPNPEVLLYGPVADYNLVPRAYTEDNTYITFPSRQVTLNEKIFKRRCLTSPDISIDDYVLDVTTDIGTGTATATVSGTVSDEDGILRIEFWLDDVKVHVIDYSATAQVVMLAQTDVPSGLLSTSVDFSYDFDLTAGLHTIRVVAVDGVGEESYDEWEVEVNTAPVASDDSLETLEDTPLNIAVASLLANDSDVDGDVLSLVSFTGTSQGMLVDHDNGSLTYTPNPNYWGLDSFSYTLSDGRGGTASATVSINILPVNDPPLASDDAYTTDEDVVLTIAAAGVLENDSDVDGDPLTASLETAPLHGSVVVNPDGSFSYTPNADYYGSDSFTYVVSDGNMAADSGAVSLTINAVNDPPVLSVDIDTQSVQYSDRITQVKFSAVDIDSAPSELTTTWTELPSSLSLSGSCLPSADGSSCSWTLDGQTLVGAGTHAIALTLSDGQFAPSVGTELIVTVEDASVAFDDGNPASVRVASDGGNSGIFALTVHVAESVPDQPAGLAAPGDISLADVSISLVPVGPGGPAGPTSCTPTSTTGTVTCSFDGVPVNTYTVAVEINGGGYYTGSTENVLTVYDPSLGFTTGGGWFNWPGTSDKTNFGYTMKYGKKGTNVKGSLLLIRHLADGQKYRIKSNALSGLAIGQDTTVPYGWASFSGKSTYLEPGMLEAEGNHGFTVYVEDHNEPGSGNDRVWITTRAKDGSTIPAMSLAEPAHTNAVPIQGGNIVAPH